MSSAEQGRKILGVAREIQEAIEQTTGTPPAPEIADVEDALLPATIVASTRPYIIHTMRQLNGNFAAGWYDGAIVMARKLVETLIIEAFERRNLLDKITTPDGDILQLDDLVKKLLSERTWKIGRTSARALQKAKWLADQAAHSRRFSAHKKDVEAIAPGLRAILSIWRITTALTRRVDSPRLD